MAEELSTIKQSGRKVKKDVFRSLPRHKSTPLTGSNNSRLSLMPNARLQKVTSGSLERLSFISEKDDSSDLENYHLEYSRYLLRKVQNRVLIKDKGKKEENVRKCLVSLKWELQDLLDKYVKLSKDIEYFKILIDVINETNEKLENGGKILKVLEESDFENLMKSLSIALDYSVNQLQLVDVDKAIIDEAFSERIWGSGSEMEECLKKIDSYISKNKEGVSKIAEELVEIKKLSLENAVLKERFFSVFEKISDEILEANYERFTQVVKNAFIRRENSKSDVLAQSLDCDFGFLFSRVKRLSNIEDTLQISKLENSYPVTPKSASTPQQPHQD